MAERPWRATIPVLTFIASLFSGPAYGESPRPPDRAVIRYKVVNLERSTGADFNLSSEIGGVKESENRLYFSGEGRETAYIMEKSDFMREGDRIEWTFHMDPETLALYRLEKKITSRSGRVVNESWYYYRDEMYDFPDNLCFMYTIPIWFLGRELDAGAVHEFNLLLSYNTAPMHMFAQVEGEEEISVPAGTFRCIKIILRPDLKNILGRWSWASPIIAPFVPDYYFWVRKEPPHVMIRFEGRFGPVGGAPAQAYELVSLNEGGGEQE